MPRTDKIAPATVESDELFREFIINCNNTNCDTNGDMIASKVVKNLADYIKRVGPFQYFTYVISIGDKLGGPYISIR